MLALEGKRMHVRCCNRYICARSALGRPRGRRARGAWCARERASEAAGRAHGAAAPLVCAQDCVARSGVRPRWRSAATARVACPGSAAARHLLALGGGAQLQASALMHPSSPARAGGQRDGGMYERGVTPRRCCHAARAGMHARMQCAHMRGTHAHYTCAAGIFFSAIRSLENAAEARTHRRQQPLAHECRAHVI
jgi:hypothetical protein